MRNSKRILRILNLIQKIWKKHPDLRLCQLIENAVPHNDNCIYYDEDDVLEIGLREKYDNVSK